MWIWRSGFATAAAVVLMAVSPEAEAQSLKDTSSLDYSPSWSGFYVGAGGGVNSLVSKFSGRPGPGVESDPGAEGASASFDGLGSSGGFGGLTLGADYQFGSRWVGGIFADYDFESLGSSVSVEVPAAPLSAQAGVDVQGKLSVGARLGYLFSTDTLWYVSGGYSNLNLSDFRLKIVGSDPDISTTAKVPNLSGGFIGAGAETRLTQRISLKAEYRYSDFGSGVVSLPTIDGTNLNDIVSVRVAPSMQEGRASLNYRF